MTIAIAGATGQLGRLVIKDLVKRIPANRIVAFARTPAKAEDLGVASREADYNRPETLERALAGVDTLLLISGNEMGERVLQHRRVIDAAKKAGVTRVVYVSVLHADKSGLGLAADHRATEGDLKASGLAYTILRNGWYTENDTGGIAGVLAGGALYGAAGDGRYATAARADYAEAAAAVLAGAGHEGKTYELAGDAAWTMAELAAEISRQSGKTIPYKNLPVAEYAAILAQVGLPAPYANMIAESHVVAGQGGLFDDSKQLSTLIGRPTTPLAVSVGEALAASA